MVDQDPAPEEEPEELSRLRRSKVEAPQETTARLQQRLSVMQAARDLVHRQAFAFWTVIDAFLRLLFSHKPPPDSKPPSAAP